LNFNHYQISILKANVDGRFDKLEKAIERFNSDFKQRFSYGVDFNFNEKNDILNSSLTLDFYKEIQKIKLVKNETNSDLQWKDVSLKKKFK